MFYVVNISFFFLAAGSRYPENLLSLAAGSRSPEGLNLFSGEPLHYEREDRVVAIPC